MHEFVYVCARVFVCSCVNISMLRLLWGCRLATTDLATTVCVLGWATSSTSAYATQAIMSRTDLSQEAQVNEHVMYDVTDSQCPSERLRPDPSAGLGRKAWQAERHGSGPCGCRLHIVTDEKLKRSNSSRVGFASAAALGPAGGLRGAASD